jgi:uncharacterized protein (TIGR02246 family)
MSTEQSVRDTVDRYYAALNAGLNGDPEPMLALWAHGTEATAMHPDGGRQMGWEEVRAQFEGWAAAVKDGRVEPHAVAIRLVTPDVAIVTAWERGQGVIGPETVKDDGRATLVLRRDGAAWKVVHHHVDVNERVRALAEAARAAATVDLADAVIPQPAHA